MLPPANAHVSIAGIDFYTAASPATLFGSYECCSRAKEWVKDDVAHVRNIENGIYTHLDILRGRMAVERAGS